MDYISHEQYAANVDARCSTQFNPNMAPAPVFKEVLDEIVGQCQALDAIKKAYFYGKVNENTQKAFELYYTAAPHWRGKGLGVYQQDHSKEFELTEQGAQILHAIIGIATEAGELIEQFREAMRRGQTGEKSVEDMFDHINLREEAGDVLWYVQLLLNAIGSNLGECLSVNDRKLEARYGKVFSAERANERDLDAERKELEK